MNKTVISKTGKYIGHVLENGVIEFLGIPYARPPQRWKPAEPLDESDEEFLVDKCGAACWQDVLPEEWPEVPPMDEDCLTLNIWSADTEQKGKPVLVWIHGGCYATGSNRTDCFNGIYCGDRFVETSPDIVYVNINYRINIFGCLDLSRFDKTGEYSSSNNLQTLDQIEALKWIHENIEAFGGDPEKITISGQSAGGMSVATLMALPEANRYFDKVICQSTALSETLLKYRKDGRALCDKFCGITGAASLQELLDIPADKLRDYGQRLFESAAGGEAAPFEQIWGEGIFSDDPCDDLRKGVGKDIKLMIGSVAGEFDTVGSYLTEEELRESAMGVFPGKITYDMVDDFAENYPERDRRTAYQDMWNDVLLRMGAIVTADAHTAGGGVTYMYYMSFVPEGAKIRPQHCFEIPYTNMKRNDLAYMDRNTNEPVQGNRPSALLEKELHGCWSNFVRYGDPNGEHIDIKWPQYTVANRETAVVDHKWTIENGVRNKDTELLLPLHLKKQK